MLLMMKIIKKSYIFFLSVAIFVFSGCAFFAGVTPRENFINFNNCDIGRHISQLVPGDKLGEKTRTLLNGNIEYTHDFNWRRRCVIVREIDSKTQRIVAWRTEGDDSGCGIAP